MGDDDLARVRTGAHDFPQTLLPADLGNAFFDAATSLEGAILGDPEYGRISVVGARWGEVDLSAVKWGQPEGKGLQQKPLWLGDERVARQPKDEDGHPKVAAVRSAEFETATRANRQLATALRDQGLNERAAEFAYRAEVCQRHALWHERQFGKWLFSLLLAGLSGYGFRLWRILAAYGATLLGFACLYWVMGVHSFPHEPGWRAFVDSFLVSFAAIHGRAAFEQLGAWSPAAWTAALQGVFGIVIEGVFIAMLIQRFFAR